MIDMTYWCESCARKNNCYTIRSRPKCFTPITSNDRTADRKTEPSNSEKPNNCEHITEDGVTCAKYPACDDCLDNPLNKVKGSERLVKGSDESQTEWIPCSERLPRARESVLLAVNHKYGDWVGEGCYWETTDNHTIWKGYRWNATYWDDEIIAWMPLPKPWKGADDEVDNSIRHMRNLDRYDSDDREVSQR